MAIITTTLPTAAATITTTTTTNHTKIMERGIRSKNPGVETRKAAARTGQEPKLAGADRKEQLRASQE